MASSPAMLLTRLQRILLLVLVALLAAIAAVLVIDRSPPADAPVTAAHSSSQFDGPTLPQGLRAAGFTLRDQSGRRVTLERFRGHVVVLTFIHSLCHDTCPFMVEQIKGALNLLPGQGRGVPVLGVSVAPREDTAASRRAFLRRHGMEARVAFLGGSLAQMRPVWHAYAMQPVRGRIDHSTFVLLIDRRGYERVGFPADQLTPEGLSHDIRVLEGQRV